MNDTLAKILKLLFNKTTLAYMVLGLIVLYANIWFNKSENSPKSIKESIVVIGSRQVTDAKASLDRDSALQRRVDDISHDQFIMRLEIDTMSNHQTPEVIKNLRLMRSISEQMMHRNFRIPTETLQPLPPIIKTEPVESKYAETLSLIDEIGLTMKEDTASKKKIEKEDL